MGALPVHLLTLSLKRSRSAHIRLHIGPNDYNRFTTVVAPTVTTQRNEYHTLWADLEWNKVVTLSRLSSNAVSHLRALSLSISMGDQDDAAPMHLPFFRALALQELTLRLVFHDIRSILDCFRFTNLAVLSLLCTASITQTKVLKFLSISPGLRRLGLDLRRLVTDEASCPRVILRGLRQLRIDVTASGDSHLRLFTNLICPIAEDVIISVQPVYFGSLEASPLQPSWGFFPRSPRVHAIELEVGQSQIETTYSVRLLYGGGSRFEISFRFVSFASRGIRALPVAYDSNEFSLFHALLRSLRALSPSGVTRLSITGIDPSAIPLSNKFEVSSSIRDLLTDVENLETLTISSGCLPAVCQALTPRPIPPIVLCPNLNSIELLSSTTSRHTQRFAAELMAMCKARAAVGYGVQNLTSTHPEVSETSIGQLDRELFGMWNTKVV